MAAIRTPQTTMGRAGVDPVKILPDNGIPTQNSAPIQQQATKRIQEVEGKIWIFVEIFASLLSCNLDPLYKVHDFREEKHFLKFGNFMNLHFL